MKVKSLVITFAVLIAIGGGALVFKLNGYKFFNRPASTQPQITLSSAFGWTFNQIQREFFSPTYFSRLRTSIVAQQQAISRTIANTIPVNIPGITPTQTANLLQSKVIEETNIARQQNGNLPALKENIKLDQAAAAKAADMFKYQYFEHTSPSGVDPSALVKNYGYNYIATGENLILGIFKSEKEVVDKWMSSPGHRANILNNRYTEIGVALVKGTYKGDTVYIGVQEFGLPMSACSEPNTALKSQIDSDKAALDQLSSQLNQKKAQINSTSQSSAAYNQMINDYNKLVADYNALANKIKQEVNTYNIAVNTFNSCVNGK